MLVKLNPSVNTGKKEKCFERITQQQLKFKLNLKHIFLVQIVLPFTALCYS